MKQGSRVLPQLGLSSETGKGHPHKEVSIRPPDEFDINGELQTA